MEQQLGEEPSTSQTMTMTDAASRLRLLTESVHAGLVTQGDEGYFISETEMKAVAVAAVILGMFVEALEDTA